MAVLILPIIFLLFLVIFTGYFNKKLTALTNLRLSLTLALISFSGIALLITESLSYFNLLTGQPMFFLYLFVGVCLSILIIILIKKRRFRLPSPKKIFRSLVTEDKIIIGAIIALYLLPLLFIAVYYPPNNADSMTYHLSRIEHWIQNKNVGHYPTNDPRQLYLQPLAEYLVLQTRLISGRDYFNNLVQLFFMLGSVSLVSLLAQTYGLKKNGQLLAAVVAITIPTGILQSTSTQTDNVATFFFLSFLYFGINIIFTKQHNLLFLSIFAGLSFGFGILTKGTIGIFILPFIVWLLIEFFKKYRFRYIELLFIIIFCALLVNSAFFTRNYRTTGSMLGNKVIQKLMLNNEINLKNTASNLVRNASLQLGLPWQLYNNFIDKIVYGFHNLTGIKTNNADTSVFLTKYKTPTPGHEDNTGNLIIIIGLTATLVVFIKFYHKFNRRKKRIIYYSLCLFSGFYIFSALLKWQPWQSRLILPLLTASALPISYSFEYLINRHKLTKIILIIALLFVSWPFVIANKTRSIVSLLDNSSPIKSRAENYFNTYTNHPESAIKEYNDIINVIEKNNITGIGLAMRPGSWEYLFWNFYQINEKPKVKIVHYGYPEYQKNTKNYRPDFKYGAFLVNSEYPEYKKYVLSQIDAKNMIEYKNLKLILILP